MASVISFAEVNSGKIISDVAAVSALQMYKSGRLISIDKQTFIQSISYVATKFVYSAFVKQYVVNFALGGISSGGMSALANLVIELAAIAATSYVIRKYALKQSNISMTKLFFEILVTDAVADRFEAIASRY